MSSDYIDEPFHPGDALELYLEDFGMTAYALAKKMGVGRHVVYELLKHNRRINPALALKLSEVFGMSAEHFIGLQLESDRLVAERELERLRLAGNAA